MVSRDPYDVCLDVARAHYENFPVASVLVPRAMCRDIAAVYAFARAADDFADEGDVDPATRHARLDDWERRVREAAAGVARDDGTSDGAIFAALGRTMASRRLPLELFTDLLSAFHQDVDVARYATWEDLLDYCRRSANPVGRLVLRINSGGRDDAALDASSDAFCTALQLTNFWQDVTVDWQKGRVYLPREDLRRFGDAQSIEFHRFHRTFDVLGQLLQEPPEIVRALYADMVVMRHNLFGHIERNIGKRRTGSTQKIDQLVTRDGMYPGREWVGRVVCVSFDMNRQNGFLNQIFGL